MFKLLDSIASVVGIFMYLTISKFKQVLRSRKGLDYNTGAQCTGLGKSHKRDMVPVTFPTLGKSCQPI